MRVQIYTYPQRLIFEGAIDANKSVAEIIADLNTDNFNTSGRSLIIDRSQNFQRLILDDPICRHYGGRLGELFRITDSSNVRYRMVSHTVALTKEKGKVKPRHPNAEIYAVAYENILTMLKDRGCDTEILSKYSMNKIKLQDATIKELTIPGLTAKDVQIKDSRGKNIYVFFIDEHNDVITSRRIADYKDLLLTYMNETIQHHNLVNGEQLDIISDDDLSKESVMKTYAAKFELLLIYNNPLAKKELDLGIKHKFYQPFPVQLLTFVVTHHMDQPKFTLLHPDRDRSEIRDMYAQNGRTLENDKIIGSYGLRENTKLILI